MQATTTGAPEADVFNEIVRQAKSLGRVSVKAEDIAKGTGLDLAGVDEALDRLAEMGLASAWTDAKGRPVATLSPLAARRLGIKIRRDRWGQAILGWQPLGRPEPRAYSRPAKRLVNATDLGSDEAGGNLDRWEGDEPSADAKRMASEGTAIVDEKKTARRLSDNMLDPDRLPWPSLILMGSGGWSREQGDGPCPVCQGRKLRPNEACGYCLEWGLAWLLRRTEAGDRRYEAERERAREARAEARGGKRVESFAQRRASKAEKRASA
jgi:hypothetical protein